MLGQRAIRNRLESVEEDEGEDNYEEKLKQYDAEISGSTSSLQSDDSFDSKQDQKPYESSSSSDSEESKSSKWSIDRKIDQTRPRNVSLASMVTNKVMQGVTE